VASLPVMLGTLVICLAVAFVGGRRLGIDADLTTLVGVGTAICGASAIAAVSPVIRARSTDVAYEIPTIFLFNVAAVLAFPPLSHLLGLDQQAFGLFAGTAVNDTSSVVAAAAVYGQPAADTAVVVKLTRTLMIIPIVLALAVLVRRRDPAGDAAGSRTTNPFRLVPWFLVGFVVAAALNTLGVVPAAAHPALSHVALFLITTALAAIGVSTDLPALRRTGYRPLVLGLVLWVAVAVSSLGLQWLTGRTVPLPPWFPDLTTLDLVLTVAEVGSVSAAAAVHGISQPSASARLHHLERRVGVPLLARSPRGTTLTPAGEAFASWATPVVTAAETLAGGVATLRGEGSARLQLAASLTVAEHLLPRWLPELRRKQLGTDIAVRVTNSHEVCVLVLQGNAELGFVEMPSVPPTLHSTQVGSDELALVVHRPTPPPVAGPRGSRPRHCWMRRSCSGNADRVHGTPSSTRCSSRSAWPTHRTCPTCSRTSWSAIYATTCATTSTTRCARHWSPPSRRLSAWARASSRSPFRISTGHPARCCAPSAPMPSTFIESCWPAAPGCCPTTCVSGWRQVPS